jgi:AcrR family transcriptional regulator
MDDNLFIQDSQTPMRSDAVQNRALLLETAQRLFNQDGVEAVSMSQIAREAGVGKGTLYRHFDDKVDLCQALLDEAQRDLQERTFARLRTGDDPHDKLVWFIEQVTQYVTSHIDLLFAGNGSLTASHLAHPAHMWWRETIYGLLMQMQVHGNVSYLADVIYVMLDVVTVQFQTVSLGYTTEQVIDGLVEALERLTD